MTTHRASLQEGFPFLLELPCWDRTQLLLVRSAPRVMLPLIRIDLEVSLLAILLNSTEFLAAWYVDMLT